MVAYSILLNLILLIGVGCIVGILVVVIMVNLKLSTLIQNMSELNKNLSNIKWNSNANNSNDSNDSNDANYENSPIEQAKIQKSAVNAMAYKSDIDAHATSFKEEQLIQEKIKSLQEIKSMNEVQTQKTNEQEPQSVVGIVFCRNCASHFTSDKNVCPICGAKRP